MLLKNSNEKCDKKLLEMQIRARKTFQAVEWSAKRPTIAHEFSDAVHRFPLEIPTSILFAQRH